MQTKLFMHLYQEPWCRFLGSKSVIASFARPAKHVVSKLRSSEAALKEARSMVENMSNQIQYDFYL